MRCTTFLFFAVLMIFFFHGNAQTKKPNVPIRKTNQVKTLKKKDFEMKEYFFVMLTKGTNRDQDSATSANIQSGHIANIKNLASMGKLLVAGPFGDESDWRGIFIFDAKNKEEVEEYLKKDPAISTGKLSYEIHPWWTAKNCVFK